jgi:hypothetical protein
MNEHFDSNRSDRKIFIQHDQGKQRWSGVKSATDISGDDLLLAEMAVEYILTMALEDMVEMITFDLNREKCRLYFTQEKERILMAILPVAPARLLLGHIHQLAGMDEDDDCVICQGAISVKAEHGEYDMQVFHTRLTSEREALSIQIGD